MSELIVLGLIPGTQIQITFLLWMLLVVGIAVGLLVGIIRRTHVVRNWIITAHFLLLTRQTIGRPQQLR